MTSDAVLATVAFLTVAVTLLLIRYRTEAVRRYFFKPIESGRLIFGAFILIAGVITALNSGVAWMMILGLVGIAFATAFFYFEEPHKDIR